MKIRFNLIIKGKTIPNKVVADLEVEPEFMLLYTQKKITLCSGALIMGFWDHTY